MGHPYRQLSMTEREYIELERRKGTSWSAIGRLLARHASTIWREVRRNARGDGFYHARRAQDLARRRSAVPRRVRRLSDSGLSGRVEQHLLLGWSPHLVAREVPLAGSPRTIYREIRTRRADAWGPLLQLPPKDKRLRKLRRERIHDRTMIDQRPAIVQQRTRIGDWEVDTIRPVGGSAVGLLVLVERKTRLLRTALLPDRSADTLNATAARLLKGLPVHTITADNGMEFASHKQLARLTGASVYFCHEHSPWERGTNEQTNKLIRYFIPRGTDLAGCSRAFIALVEALLNQRPRKCLHYLSPEQALTQASLHLKWQSAGLERRRPAVA